MKQRWLFAVLGLTVGLVIISLVAAEGVWVVAPASALAFVGYLYGKRLDDGREKDERPLDQSTGRRIAIRTVGILFAAVAVALTVAFVVVVFQAATGDWVGGEAEVVWTIAGFVGVLTAAAWAVAIAILNSAKENRRSQQFL